MPTKAPLFIHPQSSVLMILMVLLIAACKQECQVIKDRYFDNKAKDVFTYPDCNDTTSYFWQSFHHNGKLAEEGHYRKGLMEGRFKKWALNGVQTANWELKENREHGVIQYWYENGNKKEEMMMVEGVENGPYKSWYQNGKKETVGQYVSGKLDGVWTYWDIIDGSKSIYTYRKDSLWGVYSVSDSLGVTRVEGKYENGKETGEWWWRDESGTVIDSIHY
jgi:uncharacterized protein